MQFTSNIDELGPFRIDTVRPPREVVLTARLLLGDEELVAAYVEDHEDEAESVSNVFAVTRTRLIVVRGVGKSGLGLDQPALGAPFRQQRERPPVHD